MPATIFDKISEFLGPEGTREAKTGAISLLVKQITGEDPIVKRYRERNVINFTPKQVKLLQMYINKQIDAEPSDVQINIKPVVGPIILRRALPWLIGAALAGVIGLSVIKKRRLI
jgi:hypothetical protein